MPRGEVGRRSRLGGLHWEHKRNVRVGKPESGREEGPGRTLELSQETHVTVVKGKVRAFPQSEQGLLPSRQK